MATIQVAVAGSRTGLETSRAEIGRICHQLPSQALPQPLGAASTIRRCRSGVARASSALEETEQNGEVGRRALLASTAALVALGPSFTNGALAAKGPKGFAAHQDSIDKYAFLFPYGWQEVAVRGQDIVFKDVIEPLESVSVNIIKTEKTDLSELGPPDEVAKTLVEKVLAAPNQQVDLIKVQERETDGMKYYTFEFLAKSSNYTRHALGTIALGYGKFYTLTTGANERRWSKMEEKLRTVVDSFVLL